MSMPGGGPFDGPLGDIFGGARPRSAERIRKPEEKGLPWEAKVINGEYYIPLRQVAELLKQNNVLPKVREGIERRVEKGPQKT